MIKINDCMSFPLAMETIALETGVLSNMVSTVRRIFPSLVTNIENSFSLVNEFKPLETQHTGDQKQVLDNIKNVQYLQLDNFTVTVPEGFSADFIEALDICESGLDYIDFVRNVLLKEFRIYLSVFLSNKDQKISSNDISFKYKEHAKKRTLINQEFAKLYVANSYAVDLKLTKVIKRNADLHTVFDKYNTVVTRMKQIDFTVFKNEVEDIVEFINVITKQSESGKIENISPEAVNNIATGGYECALQVETASACYFRCMGITTSIDNFTYALLKRVS